MATKAISDLKQSFIQGEPQESPNLVEQDNLVTQVEKTALSTSVEFFKSLGNRPLLDHLFFAGDTCSALKSAQAIADVAAAEGVSKTESLNPDFVGVESGSVVAVVGVLDTSRGISTAEKSQKIGDHVGLFSGLLRGVIRGPCEVVRGGNAIATSVLNLTDKSLSTPKVTLGLGLLGATGGCICSTVIGATAIATMVEGRSISKKLNEKIKESEIAGFNYLKEALSITEEDKKTVLKDLLEPSTEPWYKKAVSYLGKKFVGKEESEADKELKKLLRAKDSEAIKKWLATQPDTTDNTLSVAQEQAVIERINADYAALDDSEKEKLSKLVSKLYVTGLESCKEKKQAIFNRAVGIETKNLMTEFLEDNSKVPQGEMLTKIITSAKVGINGNIRRMAWVIAACVLGIIVNVAAQVLSGGIYTLVQIGINAIIAAIWLGIDGYYLYQAYKQNHADWKDRVLMLLGTISLVVVGALATSFAQSSIGSIIITVSLLAFYLLCSLYEIVAWKNKTSNEKQAKVLKKESDSAYASDASLDPSHT